MAQDPRQSEDVEPNVSSDENAQNEDDDNNKDTIATKLQQQDQQESQTKNKQRPSHQQDDDDDDQREASSDNNDKESSANAEGQPQGEMPRSVDDFDFEVKEQDRWLPIANVARIMKSALPDNAKIAKEAKECMQECVSEFISFITSEASEKCQQEKRKTVNGEDILFAMASLGFENYGEALKIYLARYRENMLARGEQQRPTTSGGGANNSSNHANYDGNNHSAIEGGTEPGAQFGYDIAHSAGSDY